MLNKPICHGHRQLGRDLEGLPGNLWGLRSQSFHRLDGLLMPKQHGRHYLPQNNQLLAVRTHRELSVYTLKLTILGILSISTTLFHLCLSITCCSPPRDSTACHRLARSVSKPLTYIYTSVVTNRTIITFSLWESANNKYMCISVQQQRSFNHQLETKASPRRQCSTGSSAAIFSFWKIYAANL